MNRTSFLIALLASSTLIAGCISGDGADNQSAGGNNNGGSNGGSTGNPSSTPTIIELPYQKMATRGLLGPFTLRLDDDDTDIDQLSVIAQSSNTTVITNESISITEDNGSWTASILQSDATGEFINVVHATALLVGAANTHHIDDIKTSTAQLVIGEFARLALAGKAEHIWGKADGINPMLEAYFVSNPNRTA